LFRLSADGQEAVRTQVTLGRSSVSTVEIINGLKEGDQVNHFRHLGAGHYERIRVR